MKRIMFLGAFALVLGMTSCKKDWTCECADNADLSITYPKTKKKTAETACDLVDAADKADGGSGCKLK